MPLVKALQAATLEKRRKTARANTRTLIADGYRFGVANRPVTAGDFFAARLQELAPSEQICGYVDVYRPGELATPEYLIAAIRDDDTGEVRYVCNCPFWRGEWAAVKAGAPPLAAVCGWCKHTEGLALHILVCVPLVDLVQAIGAPPRRKQAEAQGTGSADPPSRGTFARAANRPPDGRPDPHPVRITGVVSSRRSCSTTRPLRLATDGNGTFWQEWHGTEQGPEHGTETDPRNEHDF